MSLTKPSGSSNVSHLSDIQKLVLLLNLLSQLPWCSTWWQSYQNSTWSSIKQLSLNFKGEKNLADTDAFNSHQVKVCWMNAYYGRKGKVGSRGKEEEEEKQQKHRLKKEVKSSGNCPQLHWASLLWTSSLSSSDAGWSLPTPNSVVMTPSHIYSYIGAPIFPRPSAFGSNVANC